VLDRALELMSSQGSAGMSMRQLATACDMNVATIYHYFPSKADLVEAVIAERRYGERLAIGTPPVDRSLAPEPRLAALFVWVWQETLEEESILRLVVGEGARGEQAARLSASELVLAVDSWLEEVVTDAFPELEERGLTGGEVARLLRRVLLGLVAEQVAVGKTDGEMAARELAATLFGAGRDRH
jgi:AcrR family transcriptional regulator